MSQQGPIIVVSSGDRPTFATALDDANLFPVIDAEWTDGIRDFARFAQGRDIRSISAPQVRRGLNGDGLGEWKRYASELAPILPLLRPWADLFGYESR